MRTFGVALAAIAVLAPFGPAVRSAGAQTVPSNSSQALVASANSLGFRLFSRLALKSPNINVLVSPTSIGLALDAIYDGARGATRSQMARVLRLRGLSMAQERRGAHALIGALAGSPQTAELSFATSFWTDLHAPVKQSYVTALQKYYNAEAQSLDFSSPQAVQTINGWVKKQTHGKISKILGTIPRGVLSYLVNALYFKSHWTYSFNADATKPHPFLEPSGKNQVEMMYENLYLPYFGNKQVQVVSLPYGAQDQKRFDMVVVLPRPGVRLNSIVSRITPSQWQSWTTGMSSTDVELRLPRFTFQYRADLVSYLKSLGMVSLFQPDANLSGMCLVGCQVNQVIHKTYIHVDEKGTVAAAATSVGIIFSTYTATVPVVVDRPFLIAIRDQETGSILFLGAVRAPSG